MTRQLLDHQARLTGYLHGMRCSQVSSGGVDRLVIDFGELTRTISGEYAGSVYLLLECPWRIETPDHVVCGWEDDEEDILDRASILIDGTVVAAEVQRPGFDLTLAFSHGCVLKVFPDCRAYYRDDLAGEVVPWRVGGDGLPAANRELDRPG